MKMRIYLSMKKN